MKKVETIEDIPKTFKRNADSKWDRLKSFKVEEDCEFSYSSYEFLKEVVNQHEWDKVSLYWDPSEDQYGHPYYELKFLVLNKQEESDEEYIKRYKDHLERKKQRLELLKKEIEKIEKEIG